MTGHDDDGTPAVSAADRGDHGAHAFPPVPDPRHITPAPEDFENPPAFANYLWPVLWCVLAGVLVALLAAYGWHDIAAH